MNETFIKSPLNYVGGKYKILPQIIPLFPKDINCFVDLFAGGANVGLNVKAKKIVLNDNLTYVIDLYRKLKITSQKKVLEYIYNRIDKYALSLTNQDGYISLRKEYNKAKNPLDLFVLIAYSFNHQIRFNNSHEFNNPFGKDRSCYNSSIESNLKSFINKLQKIDIEFYSTNFESFDLSLLSDNDFVYCDPPYLITTGTYNDGKRGFTGWSEEEELALLDKLDILNDKGVSFALSNVLRHKGKTNTILEKWMSDNSDYVVNNIKMDYANSNYHTKDRDKLSTVEVLITNYIPTNTSLYGQLPLLPHQREYNNEIYR
ncbi:MAG: Dam family site-specific DNA-(adenine-N6)-methyltransferase [Endomicrobium sp.]|uniref:Dam family site-specific DNA-(adenine-N6)-methyltransferase n=1 Tax=Candidatus Endomicrobiellum pyrsonymphae TaxID=1408203 RepID=UPI00357236F9|nr:Dam family site-specific DNA-(adenine-N6)-methyltransferase [Endomicrobium sp.]